MMPTVSILEALDDPDLFGPLFRGSSWDRWKSFLAALFALPLAGEALDHYRHHTERTTSPAKPFREAALVIGRRGGKSRILALIAVYLATFRDYEPYLAPGEQPVVAVIAADRRQARIILRYVIGTLRAVRLLVPLIEGETVESVTLSNGVTIEVHSGTIAAPRGRTFVAVLCDEISFWASDEASANPDAEVVASVRPGLISIPGSVLLLSSSPYAKRGVLWNTFRRHFGHDDARVLVWKATTLEMNPNADKAEIGEAYEEDPVAAAAEYGAQFRDDLVGYIDRAAVEACVAPGVSERPPVPGISYCCFMDPAGGAGRDSFALTIGHRASDGMVIVDCLREWRPPFNPIMVVAEAEPLLDQYHVTEIISDFWGSQWIGERFTGGGRRTYHKSEKVKSDLYLESLPVLMSGRVQLLDHPRSVTQIATLDRRTARSGKDSVDHQPGGHDDLANVLCGVIVQLAKPDAMTIWRRLGRPDWPAPLRG
jgi:hypothetical protein